MNPPVAGIARDYWLFGWLYPLVGAAGTSMVIGVLELTAGVLIALGSTGQFLARDIGLLALCVFLALDARGRITGR